jgi:predicted MFS family arabinose efflux permease
VLLVWREKRTPHALFPIVVFRNPSIWRCDALALFQGGALIAMITFLPIYLRVGLNADSAEIGILLLPVTAAVPIGAIATGFIVSITGRTAIIPTVSLPIATLLLLCAALWLRALDGAQVSALLSGAGLFMGTVMGVVQLTIQAAAGRDMLGTAAGSVQFSRTIGGALGTALVSTVLFATMTAMDHAATGILARILQEGPEVLNTLAPERAAVVRDEIVGAFRAAFVVIAVFCAAGAGLAWSLPIRRL